ncbi:collectin-11-like [Neocloeon triangulifer]|uniref:collectin-11-like n=1 Tax=Neocloeon triangulifer TaxID=2078957 RepID=UPI00286F8BE9|nr:collectin-11-like [Neocloeon triangulifer]
MQKKLTVPEEYCKMRLAIFIVTAMLVIICTTSIRASSEDSDSGSRTYYNKEKEIKKISSLQKENFNKPGNNKRDRSCCNVQTPTFIKERMRKYPSGECKYLPRSPQKTSFFEALETCQRLGLRLATPYSQTRNNDLYAILGGVLDVWIAASDLGSESFFYWVTTQEPLTFTYYGGIPGIPNNAFNEEHCLILYAPSGYWDDIQCGNYYYFVCEERTC